MELRSKEKPTSGWSLFGRFIEGIPPGIEP